MSGQSGNYHVIVDADETGDLGQTDLEFQDFNSGTAGGKIGSDANTTTRNVFTGGSGYYDSTQQETPGTKVAFWKLEFYKRFFDVDTNQVLERCAKSLIPKDNFIEVMAGNPDLYGPFWLATTVIFFLFVTSSVAGSIAAYLSSIPYQYDFTVLTFGVFLIYAYGLGLPLFLWGAMKYFGCQPTIMEMVSLYGYALTIWIPVSLFSVVPIEMLRWALVGIGFASSGFFLIRNLYPVLAQADAKTSRLLIIVILVLHAGLAFALKIGFFSYAIEYHTPTESPSPTDPTGPQTTTTLSATSLLPTSTEVLRFL